MVEEKHSRPDNREHGSLQVPAVPYLSYFWKEKEWETKKVCSFV